MDKEHKITNKNDLIYETEIQLKINLQFQHYIEEIIRTHPGASVNEISYLLDMDKTIVNYFIKKMEREGIIRLIIDTKEHILCYMGEEIPYTLSKKRKKQIKN